MTNHEISHKNCEHFINVWEASKVNNMKNYHNLYLKFGVVLLACMFETCRKESINSFEVDPAHYLSTPGYRGDAMLRFTDVNLLKYCKVPIY